MLFRSGDLKVTDDFFNNITSYSTTFYIMAGDEKNVILSNSMVDITGDTVNVSGDLGQISGDSAIRRIKIDDSSLLSGKDAVCGGRYKVYIQKNHDLCCGRCGDGGSAFICLLKSFEDILSTPFSRSSPRYR